MTRRSDVKPRGHRQSFIEFAQREEKRRQRQKDERARARGHAALKASVQSLLASPSASTYDLLMCELALDPENRADAGAFV